MGYAPTLMLTERPVALTLSDMRGHARGLHTPLLDTGDAGVTTALAGTAAQYTSPATGMVAMAAVSVAVTPALMPGVRAAGRTAVDAAGDVRAVSGGACTPKTRNDCERSQTVAPMDRES